MPRLTFTSLRDTPIPVSDPDGFGRSFTVPPLGSITVDFKGTQLEAMAIRLEVLRSGGYLTWTKTEDPSTPDDLELMAPVAVAKNFVWTAPSAADLVSIHTGHAASADTLFTAATNPLVARNLQVALGPGWDGGDVTVEGLTQFGRPTLEVFTAGSSVTRVGVEVFATVTRITHSVIGASGALATVGVGNSLGVSGRLATLAAALLFVDNTPGPGTLENVRHSITPTGIVPNGIVSYLLCVNVYTE